LRQEHTRALVVDVQAQRDRPAIAKEELARKHRQSARELRHEAEQREQRAAAERRREEARRADLIKQIRALELVPRKRETRLDPTYTPQLGLLEEMSLAELRERLMIVEEQRGEDERTKRSKILAAKQEREQDLAQRAQRLSSMRERAAVESSAKRVELKAAERAAVEERKERVADAQLKVQETLEQKRALRLQKEAELATELRRIRIKNQFLEADKEAVERKKAESQQAGEQREIVAQQRAKLEAAQAHLSVFNKESQQRLHNVQREREAHEAFLREYESHFVELQADAEAREADTVNDHAQKLATRQELKATKAAEAAWSRSMPGLEKSASRIRS
jgi:hypothetical protein